MIPTNKFLLGAAVGFGTAVAGYCLYKKNQDKVDSFLREQGFHLPSSTEAGYQDMSLEELMLNKERLEDLIAEKEMPQQGDTPAEAKG